MIYILAFLFSTRERGVMKSKHIMLAVIGTAVIVVLGGIAIAGVAVGDEDAVINALAMIVIALLVGLLATIFTD